MEEDIANWNPLAPDEVLELLGALDVPWWLAGGWAIELFVGAPFRDHGDTDVVIRYEDQLRVQEYLAGWDLQKTKQPGLAPWPNGETLAPHINDIWCRRTPDDPWSFQLMLLQTDGDRWVFKRNPAIGGALNEFGRMDTSGMRCIRPEIQLLYKARAETIAKDAADFAAVEPLLVGTERKWLRECLEKQFPNGHEWIERLG